jgi:hypothetical protein
MKDTLISILQQRMDKCTSQQFWSVTTASGITFFYLSHAQEIGMPFLKLAILAILVINWLYIANAHIVYYSNQSIQARLISEGNTSAKELEKSGNPSSKNLLHGVALFTIWIVVLAISVIAHNPDSTKKEPNQHMELTVKTPVD